MRESSRRWRWIAFGAPVAVAALLLGMWGFVRLSPAHAATVYNARDIPVSDTIVNSCGGEDVAVSGAIHIAIHSTTDAAGGIHDDIQVNTQGETGVGLTSGAKYQVSGGHHANLNFTAADGSTQTNSQDSRLIGQGPDNNSIFTFLFHLTVNPDGTTTASFTDFKVVCH
jgi:hypothetical protein